MAVRLNYSFDPGAEIAQPEGPHLDSPLFLMLSAIEAEGSIGGAARILEMSYRHVWGFLKKQEAAYGQRLLAEARGQGARLTPFGERLLWAERRVIARFLPAAENLASALDSALLQAIDSGLAAVPVCASHDLLFGALRERVRQEARVLLDVSFEGSSVALHRLNEGSCRLAGIHLPLGDERLCRRGSAVHRGLGRMLRLGDHKLIRFASRDQGMMVARGNPLGVRSLGDLAGTSVRFVNRAAGSGTRLLFDDLLAVSGVEPAAINGYATAERTHLSVAASVAAGSADCGFGLRAAAARFGLDFLPMVIEQYFVVCRKPDLESDAVRAVRNVLGSQEFRAIARSLPGYDADRAGEIVSLRRTLPWYK